MLSVGRSWAVMKPMLVLMVTGLLSFAPLEVAARPIAPWPRAAAMRKAPSMVCGTARVTEFISVNSVRIMSVTRYRFDDQRHILSSSFAKRAEIGAR